MSINYDRHTQAFSRKQHVPERLPTIVATIGALIIGALLMLITYNYEMTSSPPHTNITAPGDIPKPPIQHN